MRIVHADALVTGDRQPIVDGAVVISESGRIVDVGAASELRPRHAGLSAERVRGVVMPGLVNAHAHVELSALRGLVSGGAGFVAWVDKLIDARLARDPEHDDDAMESAADDLIAFGTAAIGDVSNSLASVRPLVRRAIAGSVFHEVFGVRRAQVMARVAGLRQELEERVGAWPSSDLAYAPSPHTLFTTHPDAVRALLDGARVHGVRTSLHLAEHSAERRIIERGDGPVSDWMRARVRLHEDETFWPRRPLFEYAQRIGALAPHVLLVHLADATRRELDCVAGAGAPVVLCPRSNLYIETRLPPLLDVRAAGIEPALGTDSLASNASLDVLAEAKALADRFPSIPARELLQMATWNGARALGRSDMGRIAKDARPGLVAVEGEVEGDPAEFVLKNVKAPRRWIVRRTGKR
jgi:cytosine/adenosine deaminase-related metal-dependent hydrolase